MKTFLFITLFCGSLCFIQCHEVITASDQNYPQPMSSSAIAISSPSKGENWKPGREYTIKWTTVGEINKVNIIVIKKQRYHKHIIASHVENIKSYEWQIPVDLIPSVSYQIRVEESNNPDNHTYSEVFQIKE